MTPISIFRMKSRQRRGTAAAEFALVAPALFLISFASFEFMRVGLLQSAADVASYEAARAVIVPGAKIQEAQTEADRYLNYLGGRTKTVTVEARDSAGVLQDEINDFTARVHVAIEIPVGSNVLLLSRFFGNYTIQSSTTLTFESYSGFYDGSSF